MMHLPHSEEAILDIRKIEDYCLSPSHPRGRHEARVFRQSNEASQIAADEWGAHWRLDIAIRRHGKSAVVRTVWIV